MNKLYKNQKKIIDFQEYLSEQLKDPKIKKYYDEYAKQLEISYKILQLRKQAGISQSDLAKKIGAKQSNIARMEAGEQNFTIATVQKIASALNRNLKIEFVK
ncbi:helix-turn-helix domain-containing protein [Patescibacteria group bacterium]